MYISSSTAVQFCFGDDTVYFAPAVAQICFGDCELLLRRLNSFCFGDCAVYAFLLCSFASAAVQFLAASAVVQFLICE